MLDGSATKTIFKKPIDVGVDPGGHDVRFYGAASGEQMLWDSSESQLKINHDTDDYGLGIFTVSSATMTQPQVKIGRDEGQYWGVFTNDRNATLIHRQDETSGTMRTKFQQWDSNTSDTAGVWEWQHGDGSGSSLSTAMTLTQAGDLSFTTGNITSDSSFSSDLDVLDITVNKTGGSAVTNVKGINLNVGSNDHVSGNDITNLYGAYINNSTSGGSATVIQNWYGVYVPAADSDRVSNRISAYFADNVGIGTDSPGYKLHVSGGGLQTTTATGNRIAYYDGSGINAYGGSSGYAISNYNGDIGS
jgi:hypothetical protein